MRNEKVHSTLLACVGAYVLYMAYQILDNFRNGAQEMPDYLYILVITAMTLGGLGVLYYAWISYRRARNEKKRVNEKQDKEGKQASE